VKNEEKIENGYNFKFRTTHRHPSEKLLINTKKLTMNTLSATRPTTANLKLSKLDIATNYATN